MDEVGTVKKKNKNLFTYHGPFHDLNSEIQKENMGGKEDEIDELDNEVAMISQKSPKGQGAKEESKEKDETNTRNFNSIPRNYNDASDSGKSESGTDGAKNTDAVDSSNPKTTTEGGLHKGHPLGSITIFGAKNMQSKINLIPLFNIKSLFQRNNRLEEVLNIEYMCGLSLICSRRYVQASESFKRVQARVLTNLKSQMQSSGREDLTTEMFTGRDQYDPEKSKYYSEMMRAAELEILIAE